MNDPVFDLHCHTIHSDGELIPAELIRRAEVVGLSGIALTDHADASNLECLIEALRAACESERQHGVLRCVPGVELTHVRPKEIPSLVERARALGAAFVVVHGESPVEPVSPGTNRAAVESGCDLLAHPGMIDRETVRLAAERGVLLEISGKEGHSLGNGRLASLAREEGAKVVYGGDNHVGSALRTPAAVLTVLRLAGLKEEESRTAILAAGEAFAAAEDRVQGLT